MHSVYEIGGMQRVTDQTGRTVEVPDFPERIISLVPSLTELLYDLGMGQRVVGITKFCIHPQSWFKEKTRVGGTKILRHSIIDSLNPDLIIANKEENTREDVELLGKKYPVWVSNVNTLEDALVMIRQLGVITTKKQEAEKLALQIDAAFAELQPGPELRTVYLIWRKPYMAAGHDTFINDMMQRCGFQNVIAQDRYPELKEQDLLHSDPELVLFSSEPYPFKEHHMEQLQKLLPHTRMQLINGEPFSWYGSRLLQSVPYFKKLLDVVR